MIRIGALTVALLAAGAVAAAEPAFVAQKLPATGLKAGDQFGSAVAVGDRVIAVGAYLSNGGAGAVHLFGRTESGEWKFLRRLDGKPGEWFGFDVAFDSGGTLLIGAPSPGEVGKVYIHDGQGLRLLVAGGAAGDELGSSVSADQGWVAVGARGSDQRSGRVYVFNLSENPPNPRALELPSRPAAGAELGQSVSLRAGTLAAGAPLPGKDGRSPGTVYLSKLNGTWGPLEPIPGAGLNARSAFGYGVAVQGSQVVVGAPLSEGRGAVFLCDGRKCDVYQPGQKNDQMGVAVAADGGRIVTGARGVDGNQGAVYQNLVRLTKAGVTGAELGFAVAVRGDTIVAGAFREGGTGAAYVFEPEPPACDPRIELTSPKGPLRTSESGTSLEFKVKLTCKPASPVPLSLLGDADEATVEPASLQSAGEHTVTVTGEEDNVCDGPRDYSLQVGDLPPVPITNRDIDVCLGVTEEVCVTPDGVAVYQVSLENTGSGRLEDGAGSEHEVELPEDVRVTLATADRGVVTVDHVANTVAWNGSLPVGGEALVRILAPLEPGADPAYDPCP